MSDLNSTISFKVIKQTILLSKEEIKKIESKKKKEIKKYVNSFLVSKNISKQ